ncbi:predicted protein [Uncinocarpus reesii 1704]|uniref:Uncharacterized protein n=1 Tax=Uncinocarpus reesii (strain UAMH 1704) TaxID=336963 RepID=C4JZ37_UNCRE|nr:uncharacterized protein UREG_07438 [Uncinocarpus reesii 1704]EEP82573.1 predicted protein [Uncinocarpus reesii 1704]
MEKNNPSLMPVPNGDTSHTGAEPSSYLTPSKRKHDATAGDESNLTPVGEATPVNSEPAEDSVTSSLKDILEVISEYDSELKLLQYPLPSKSKSERENKRAKLSEPDAGSNIESKVTGGAYKSLEEFIDDIETVAALVSTDNPQATDRPEHLKSLNANELSVRASLFKKQLNNLLLRSRRLQPLLVNSEASQSQEESLQSLVPPHEDRAILTVTFGNPPRTYFSSFQQTNGVSSVATPEVTDKERSTPVDESVLPGDIRISKVMPFNATQLQKERGTTRTFGEVFQPPSHLPQLTRPQKFKQQATDNVVRWLQPVDILAASSTTLSGQKLYNNKKLSPGHWLNYGRDSSRGKLSSINNSDDSGAAGSVKEDEAIFRSIYSSFAPGYDSGGAVLQNNVQNLVYWDRRGQNKFNQLFPDWHFDEAEPVRQLFEKTTLEPEPLNDIDLRLAVESFDPNTNIEDLEKIQNGDTETSGDGDVEHILQEISDLLKTLHSYRRLRNLYPTPGQLPNTSSKAFSQLSDTPSEEEKATYDTLKQSLSSMIALLPPYALAKLDGDQLADLNIKTAMNQGCVDYAGTMEEDEWTMRQKQAPRVTQSATRSPAPSTHLPRAPTYQTPQHQNIAPHQRYQPTTRARNASTSYTPQSYGTRQPTQAIPYQPTHPAPAYAPTPPTSQRFVQPQYQQSPPASTPQYTRSGMLQQFQRPNQNGPNAYTGPRGLSPSQTQQQQQYPRQVPQSNYQPRANAPSAHRPPNYAQTPQRQPSHQNSVAGSSTPKCSP